jgi:hypothetical protein
VSAGVHRAGEEPKPKPGFHVYLPVTNAADIPRFGDVLGKRLWLAGHGFIALAKNGALLERTLVDGAVFSPERLDFAGLPWIVGEGLEYTPPAAVWREGGYLDTQTLPDLSPEEEAQCKRLLSEAKARAKPQADMRRGGWIEGEVVKMVAKGAEPAQAKATLERIADGQTMDLPPGFVLHFATLGTQTVADVLADLKKYDGQALADPIEGPDYGKTTAKFWANTGRGRGVPCVHSFAHGEDLKYFPKFLEIAKNPTLPTLPEKQGAASYTNQLKTYTDRPESYTEPGVFIFTDKKGGQHLFAAFSSGAGAGRVISRAFFIQSRRERMARVYGAALGQGAGRCGRGGRGRGAIRGRRRVGIREKLRKRRLRDAHRRPFIAASEAGTWAHPVCKRASGHGDRGTCADNGGERTHMVDTPRPHAGFRLPTVPRLAAGRPWR